MQKKIEREKQREREKEALRVCYQVVGVEVSRIQRQYL